MLSPACSVRVPPVALKVTTALLLMVRSSPRVPMLSPAINAMLAPMVALELIVSGLMAAIRPPATDTRPRPSAGLSRSLIVRPPMFRR